MTNNNTTRTPSFIAAQVACESVIDQPDAFEPSTIAAVLANGEEQGVSDFYLDMIRPLV